MAIPIIAIPSKIPVKSSAFILTNIRHIINLQRPSLSLLDKSTILVENYVPLLAEVSLERLFF